MQTLYLQVQPSRIGWLRFILEGYDHLALLTTVGSGGLVRLCYDSRRGPELIELLGVLARQLAPDGRNMM